MTRDLRTPARAVAAVLLAGLVAAGVAASAHGASLAPGAEAVTSVRLANDWPNWRPSRVGPGGGTIQRSRDHRLQLRLSPAARTGTTALFTLKLPRGVFPTILRFRASYATTGGEVFVASGSRTRKLWSRRDGSSGNRIVAQVPLSGRRLVIIGVTARGPAAAAARRDVSLRLHAYSVSTPGRITPLPSGSAVGGGLPPRRLGPDPRSAEEYTGPSIYWGTRIGGRTYGPGYGDAPYDLRSLSLFEQHARKGASILIWGQRWIEHGSPASFNTALFESVRQRGTIPMVDWSPWAHGGYDAPDFQLGDVIAGNYDAYIREWATAAAAWGKPFFLRYCHEMNGDWYPWSERRNGNSAGQFVQAWRHVHDIFQSVGATNVSWVWSPNEFATLNGIPIAGLYPGSDYVDWAGMSGYNWGDWHGPNSWRPFTKVFSKTYASMRQVAVGKPLMITEMASTEGGGSKAAWIRDTFEVQLPMNYPAIRAVVWWNRDENRDWPIETSATAQATFAEVIGSPYYAGNRFSNITASPIPPL